MRITVGHVLILGGLGAYVAVSGAQRPAWMSLEKIDPYVEKVKANIQSLTSLLKSGETGPLVVESPIAVPKAEEAPAAAVSTMTASAPLGDLAGAEAALNGGSQPAAEQGAAPATPAPAAPAVAQPEVKKPAPVVRKRAPRRTARRSSRNRRRTPPRKAAAPAPRAKPASAPATQAATVQPAAQNAAATTTGGAERYMGQLVSMKLKTGRDVTGILESVTAGGYKLQLPGLGSFDYPRANVIEVRPAE